MRCKRCGKEANLLYGVIDEDTDYDIPARERNKDKDHYCLECMRIVHKETMESIRAVIESMTSPDDEKLH